MEGTSILTSLCRPARDRQLDVAKPLRPREDGARLLGHVVRDRAVWPVVDHHAGRPAERRQLVRAPVREPPPHGPERLAGEGDGRRAGIQVDPQQAARPRSPPRRTSAQARTAR